MFIISAYEPDQSVGLFTIHNGHNTQSSHTKPTSHHPALFKVYCPVLVIIVNIKHDR